MTNIPINANVQCTDGPCGQCTNVIVNPVNHQVTHFALQDKSLPNNPTRLVPVTKVAGVTQQQITLNCTRADVTNMSPFIVTDFIQQSGPGMAYASGEAYHSQYVVNDTAYDAVQETTAPGDELSLYSGMQVEATDGKVGKLDELVLDPQSGEVTHVMMREGHLWGKRDVAIPASDIEFCDDKSVYLKLDKAAVKALPAVKVKRQ
jgi:sporulation protein YlmC with PRC-barrel domain